MSKKNHCAVCDIIYPITYDSCPLCEALQELKYLREHMENAGGDNWADAEPRSSSGSTLARCLAALSGESLSV